MLSRPNWRSTRTAKARALRQATALADLNVAEAEGRLDLDWKQPLRRATFYKAVYRPAVLRANRLTPTAALPPELKFHALRHTYASLCVAEGIKPAKLSDRMDHANVQTTLDVYVHLFPTTTRPRTWPRSARWQPGRHDVRRKCCAAARLAGYVSGAQ